MSHNLTLNYHGLDDSTQQYGYADCEKPYVVSAKTFDRHLDILSSERQILDVNNLNQDSFTGSGKNTYLLTFDDGHQSHYDIAVPTLKRKGLKGVFFISAGLVGSRNLMTWGQLQEVIHEGHIIGSHGLNHVPLKDLSTAQLEEEIIGSKDLLEHKLDIQIDCFSIPRGYFHPRICEMAKKAGYKLVFTSEFGYNRTNTDAMRISRIPVLSDTKDTVFQNWVRGQLGSQLYREKIKSAVRRTFPPSLYDQLARLKRSLK